MQVKNQTWRESFLLLVKGVAMGMANKIPGVSGGIVALATGFYEELIISFSRFDATAIRHLVHGKFKSFYLHVNGSFLLTLFSGVGISFFSVSLLLDHFLRNNPKQVLGLFMGMIITSVYFIWKDIDRYRLQEYIGSLFGILFGVGLFWLSPGSENDHWAFVFFCGMVSISGMTLPGLSGSLLLLILGNYSLLLVDSVNALFFTFKDIVSGNGLNWLDPDRKRLLGVFVYFTLGSTTGLIFFSKALKVILTHFKSLTIATLVGFILGSLGAVWPWTEQTINANDKISLLAQTPYKIFYFPSKLDIPTSSTLFFILLGGVTVAALEYYGKKNST